MGVAVLDDEVDEDGEAGNARPGRLDEPIGDFTSSTADDVDEADDVFDDMRLIVAARARNCMA